AQPEGAFSYVSNGSEIREGVGERSSTSGLWKALDADPQIEALLRSFFARELRTKPSGVGCLWLVSEGLEAQKGCRAVALCPPSARCSSTSGLHQAAANRGKIFSALRPYIPRLMSSVVLVA
ncbi:unnamed protein product, partial [Ixodes persulcatus]